MRIAIWRHLAPTGDLAAPWPPFAGSLKSAKFLKIPSGLTSGKPYFSFRGPSGTAVFWSTQNHLTFLRKSGLRYLSGPPKLFCHTGFTTNLIYIYIYIHVYTSYHIPWNCCLGPTRLDLFALARTQWNKRRQNVDRQQSPPSSWSLSVLEFLPIPSPRNAVTSVTSVNPFQSFSIQASRHQTFRSRPRGSEILIYRGIQSGGTGCHRPPQGLRHSAPRTCQIHRKPWKFIKIHENLCKSMQIYKNL